MIDTGSMFQPQWSLSWMRGDLGNRTTEEAGIIVQKRNAEAWARAMTLWSTDLSTHLSQ